MLLAPLGERVSRIDLTRADLQPLDFSERLDLPVESCGDDVVSASDLELAGSVERAGSGYLLQGDLRGTAQLQCVRCLVEFPLALQERIELVLLPDGSAPREDETRLGRGDLEVRFYGEPMIDLAELAAEQVLLAAPVKPLCNEGCRGLCRRCGANLNQGDCSCGEERDERWAPLESWRPSK